MSSTISSFNSSSYDNLSSVINIDYLSVTPITNYASEVVVYGSNTCRYIDIARQCNQIGLHRYYTEADSEEQERLNEILLKERLELDMEKQTIASLCKVTITNLVLTNYARKLEKKPIIPALFLISIMGDNSLEDPNFLTVRTDRSRITIKEIRRIYKLANKYPDELVRQVANETFRFVRVNVKLIRGRPGYVLEKILPPWSHKDWQTLWDKREASTRVAPVPKKHLWQSLLGAEIKKYLSTVGTSSLSSSSSSSSSPSSSSATLPSSSTSTLVPFPALLAEEKKESKG